MFLIMCNAASTVSLKASVPDLRTPVMVASLAGHAEVFGQQLQGFRVQGLGFRVWGLGFGV